MAAEEGHPVSGHREGIGMMYYIEQALSFAAYVFLTVSVYQSIRAEDRQDKIIYMLWTIVLLMIAIADAVVK
jgi:hypothetical protein